MNAKEHKDISQLCIHTVTTRPWQIEEAAKNYSAETGKMLLDHDLTIVSLCRGGFFPGKDLNKRKSAIDDNRRAIDEACQLGTSLLVLVCGADPSQGLEEARKQIRDGIAEIIPEASAAGVKLAIEPLHPMYADTRSAINTMSQANDMVEELNSPWVGVAVDVYHLWWDPFLEKEIMRCGQNGRLMAFHICDWKVPTRDILLDRGLMGEGCIPIKKIRSWVEAAGFTGFNEVEIFSTTHWKENQSEFLQKIIKAYKENS